MLRGSKKGSRCHGDHCDSRICSLAGEAESTLRSRDRVERLKMLGLDRERRSHLHDSLSGRRREITLSDLADGMQRMELRSPNSLRDRIATRNLSSGNRGWGRDDDTSFQFRPIPFRPGIEADRLLNRERMQRRRPPVIGSGGGYRRGGLMPLDGFDDRGTFREGFRGGIDGRIRDGLGLDATGGIGRGPGGLGRPGDFGGSGGLGGSRNGPSSGPSGLSGGSGGIGAGLGDMNPSHTLSPLHPRQPYSDLLQSPALTRNPSLYPPLHRPQLLLENHDPRALDREPLPYGPYAGWQPNYRHPYVEDYVSQLSPEEWEEMRMQEQEQEQIMMQQQLQLQLQQAQMDQAQGQGLQLSELQRAVLLQQQQQQQQLGLGVGLGAGIGQMGYGLDLGLGLGLGLGNIELPLGTQAQMSGALNGTTGGGTADAVRHAPGSSGMSGLNPSGGGGSGLSPQGEPRGNSGTQ